MQISKSIGFRRSKFSSQRGSGDGLTILMVLGLCVAISVTLMVLNWVKTTKDERIERRNMPQSSAIDIKRGPGGYQVEY